MAKTARKVNFMISDDVKKEFEKLVPAGERSKIVNEALRRELISIKRKKLTEKLLSLRVKGTPLSTIEIVETIRKDRRRAKQL